MVSWECNVAPISSCHFVLISVLPIHMSIWMLSSWWRGGVGIVLTLHWHIFFRHEFFRRPTTSAAFFVNSFAADYETDAVVEGGTHF